MLGYRFSKYIPQKAQNDSAFENLLNIFLQLVSITGGDAAEALNWLTNLDKEYNITNGEYGIGDFIDEMKNKGYLTEDAQSGNFDVTDKTGQKIRKAALEEIFGKLIQYIVGFVKPVLVMLEAYKLTWLTYLNKLGNLRQN